MLLSRSFSPNEQLRERVIERFRNCGIEGRLRFPPGKLLGDVLVLGVNTVWHLELSLGDANPLVANLREWALLAHIGHFVPALSARQPIRHLGQEVFN